MHSMSGAAGGPGGGRGAGQLYGEHQPASGFVQFGNHHGDDDDVGSVFFQSPAYGAGGDAGGGLTEYLQGFLDPAGLARHFDATPTPTNDAVKPGSAAGDVTGHDGRHGQPSVAAAAPVATPNSSTSSEPRRGKRGRPAPEEGDEEGEVDEEGSTPDHQNSRSDVKKGKVEKKARGSRVAFATKSEVDHLDDGYRWRKYGQKAVKNSSFPRSYYRCTAARCGVKKQVERSQQDPATVVTTYEGQHAHPSPAAHREPVAAGANALYSLASLQQQGHDFAATVRSMTPLDAASSPDALLPHQAEHRLAEYYGLQLQDLAGPLLGNQHMRH